jgi:hydrogenase nickel incorporation protein HypA/HybF
MHELGIMQHIVEEVLRAVEYNGLTEIEAIVLQVGELSSIVPKYLRASYPAATDGTLLENADLVVEMLPANAVCRGCGMVFSLTADRSGCPRCESAGFEIISGREFYIKEIRAM